MLRGPTDHIKTRILQTMVSGIPLSSAVESEYTIGASRITDPRLLVKVRACKDCTRKRSIATVHTTTVTDLGGSEGLC